MLLLKREALINTGIYHTVNLSKYPIESDSFLVAGALCFWNPIFNHFQFRFGPIGPTVLDICHILGFFSHGEDAHPYMVESNAPSIRIDPKSLGYSHFLSTHMSSSREVSNFEFYCFILYWLSKYLFCTTSQRVVFEFLNIAKALVVGKKLALAPFVLGYLY